MTSSASSVRGLSDTLAHTLLAASPFAASQLGLREYDARVPDASVEADERLATALRDIDTQAQRMDPDDARDRVTLAVIRSTCERQQRDLGARAVEYTVAPIPLSGPPGALAALARSVLVDAQAADDYLERVKGSAGYFDQVSTRLRDGAAQGRTPVRSLVDRTVEWADATLAQGAPAAITAPQPPAGWDGADGWREDVERLARDEVAPALARWRDALQELRSVARPDEAAGLRALPDGERLYADCIASHTTLPFTADELHRIGLETIERLEQQAVELGATIGLSGLDEIRRAARLSADALSADEAIAAAREAVRRAEARAHELMPEPLPGPCDVTPMPATVADSGMAPHYTRPRDDGSRPGTYWFNTVRATAGTGWDLEPVAFHETVPGHHSQLARLQRLDDLPLLQQISLTVHAEGWGLYAERLAAEVGLYSSVEAELGAIYTELFRAARLVLDTGLHAFGWSRQKAREYFVDHVALPEQFLHDEIDRYISWPGQALAYLVGQREILRLRDEARATLGDRFELPAFHATILDSGNLPMPALEEVVRAWAS
jgi:uncharacterized protein (DUF885 family)